MAVFSLKQLLEAGGIFRISRTSDARPYGFDKVRMGTNLSGALRQLPLGRGAYGCGGFTGQLSRRRGANVNTRRCRRR